MTFNQFIHSLESGHQWTVPRTDHRFPSLWPNIIIHLLSIYLHTFKTRQGQGKVTYCIQKVFFLMTTHGLCILPDIFIDFSMARCRLLSTEHCLVWVKGGNLFLIFKMLWRLNGRGDFDVGRNQWVAQTNSPRDTFLTPVNGHINMTWVLEDEVRQWYRRLPEWE